MSELLKLMSSSINDYSRKLEDRVFKARIAAFGEYEGFTRGKTQEVLNKAIEKVKAKECYYLKLSFKLGTAWDEFELVSCSGKILMAIAKVHGKTYYGEDAVKLFESVMKKHYSLAIAEFTKISENILPGKPLPPIKPPKKVPEKAKPAPTPTPPREAVRIEVPRPITKPKEAGVREFLTKTILPVILNKEDLIKKICQIYTEVYGYRFRDSKIRVTEKDVELIIELSSTSSTWAKPNEVVKNLMKTHITPRLDKWVKAKVPVRIMLIVNGKAQAEMSRA